MEKNLLDLLSEDILSEKKDKKEKKEAGAVSVLDSNSSEMRLKPKSGDYITINYEDLAAFLKKEVGRTFTRSSAKKFAESLRKFLGLTTEAESKEMKESWSYSSTSKSNSLGKKLSFEVKEIDSKKDIWELIISDLNGEVSDKYTGSFMNVLTKMNKLKPEISPGVEFDSDRR